MKRDVYLNYSSTITGLGNLDETWHTILNGQSSVVKKEHFHNKLLPATGLALYKRDLSNSDLNITQHLMEECLSTFPKLPRDTYVIWTGIKNNAEDIEGHCLGTGKPSLSSAHDFRLWLTGMLGLNNGGMEINAACASSTIGVALAMQFIADGRYDHVLVAGADIVSRFVYYGFAALKGMKEEVCMPFDTDRSGLSLGDGAVALFLSAERDSNIRLAGFGMTNDANHITGPSRDGSGLAKAFSQAITMAELKPDAIQAFCAHGTATRYNDSMELMAVQSVFGKTAPKIFSVKGSIGHTLGAAGGIEVALCGRSLIEGVLPPTVGCKNPESPQIVLEKTPYPGENILTSNSGFGGTNAAILMEKVS